MKKIKYFISILLLIIIFTACGTKEVKPDYTTNEAETALNNGEDLTGKTVQFTVDKYVPDGSLGYTIQTGEHLNFISTENPNVKSGDTVIAKIKKVENLMGSWIITFDKK
ncbi:hypothetical protein KUB91_002711 [Enterococcus faecalis]|nr:hypothetical protein [Enterococcus faecalis]EKK0951208.1 hypothetical protein [Enterococcus faecalis]